MILATTYMTQPPEDVSKPATPPDHDAGKVTVRLPLVPGVASWDFELDADRFKGPLWTRRSRAGKLGVMAALAVLVGLVGFGGWRLVRREASAPEPPALYAVRVVPVDEAGLPVEDATVRASVGNEPQQVAGGWEIEVPRVKLPTSGALTVWAEQAATAAHGEASLVLGTDPTPSVRVALRTPETRLRGTVVDAAGRALAGARVSVLGYGAESGLTDAAGSFDLAAHRPPGERVRLHVEHPGHPPMELYCFAGGSDCYVELGR